MSEGLLERLRICHKGYHFVFIRPSIAYYKQNPMVTSIEQGINLTKPIYIYAVVRYKEFSIYMLR